MVSYVQEVLRVLWSFRTVVEMEGGTAYTGQQEIRLRN